MSYLKRPLRATGLRTDLMGILQVEFWGGLAGYAETPQGRSRFRGNAIEALGRVRAVYPELKIEIQTIQGFRDGCWVLLHPASLHPSMTHIPKTPVAP